MVAREILSDDSIFRLTTPQRELLLEHIDGEVGIIRTQNGAPRAALMSRGLLRFSTSHHTPRATILTEEGRRALGMILGAYADALVRAGILEQSDPISVLRRLKALRSGRSEPESFVPDIAATEPLRIQKN